MERLFPRCSASLDIRITVPGDEDQTLYHAHTSNLSLGGMFVRDKLPHSENDVLLLSAQLSDAVSIKARGKVLRKNGVGFAIEFLDLSPEIRSEIWAYLQANGRPTEECPYCGFDNPQSQRCSKCGRDLSVLHVKEVAPFEKDTVHHTHLKFSSATEAFISTLEQVEDDFNHDPSQEDVLYGRVAEAFDDLFERLSIVERGVSFNRIILKQLQDRFRNETNRLIVKGYLYNRARTWPQGYPGDYLIIDHIYRNMPLSTGLGRLLDRRFLNATLAVAVKERRVKMGEILSDELGRRRFPKILNIGCGPCREIRELVHAIEASQAEVTCLDFDSDALTYAGDRLSLTPIASNLRFRKYNVMRMVSRERNHKHFGEQDIIYSMGLFDYLDDDTNIRLISSLYDLLKPAGSLILAFKDADKYATYDYHWMTDWEYFKQRTFIESWSLFEQAGIPRENITIDRDTTGVIIFYNVRKP